MSHSPDRCGRPLVARSSSRSGVPSGLTAIPSSVVRASFDQAASSASSSDSRPALRSTAAAAFSQSARAWSSSGAASASVPCSGSSSVGSSSPPSTSVMVLTIGGRGEQVPASVTFSTRSGQRELTATRMPSPTSTVPATASRRRRTRELRKNRPARPKA